MKFLKAILLSFLLSGFITTLVVGTLYTRIEGTELNKEAFILDTKPTIIYDTDGKVLAKFFKDRRSLAIYEEIPTEIIDALISTEDRMFFQHAGINVRSISRAAIRIFQAGDIVEGGSTITQQLIKRTHLTAAKTLERKQQEAIYATILEQNFSKEEILEMYLNQVEYKYKAFGVKDAMMTYFGHTFEEFKKLPREERIIKSALLAGMVQNPSRIDPFQDQERALKRRDLVIENLKNTGKITKQEYEMTIGKPLMVLDKPLREFNEEKFDNFEVVHYALFETANKLKTDIESVMDSGYDIYTSFDMGVYKIIREEYSKDSYFPDDASDGTKVSSAAVYLNPKNGEIIGFTGGRKEVSENEFLGFNNAFMMTRQPGSTIKPIISYGPALESGKFGRYSLLADDKGHSFPGGYVVKNWDNGGRGKVTMEEALRQSWNIPAVWTLQQVGVKYAVDYAKKLGIDFTEETSGLSMALGGVDNGVSPLEMADSYQAFANGGIRTPAHAIRKIVDSNKKTLYELEIEKEPIINPQNAQEMKEMLQIGVSRGTSTRAQIDGYTIGGKTGTTQHPFINGANKDIWFVGFDEEYVLGAIWMGFESSKYALYDGSKLPAKMYSKMTEKIIKYLEEKTPDDQKRVEVKDIDGLTSTVDEENGNVQLKWNEYGENVVYNIHRDGVLIKQTDSLEFLDENLDDGEYYYRMIVTKKDGSAVIAQSNRVKVDVKKLIVEEPVLEEPVVVDEPAPSIIEPENDLPVVEIPVQQNPNQNNEIPTEPENEVPIDIDTELVDRIEEALQNSN